MRPAAQTRIEAELTARIDELEAEVTRLRIELTLRDRWIDYRDRQLARLHDENVDLRRQLDQFARLWRTT